MTMAAEIKNRYGAATGLDSPAGFCFQSLQQQKPHKGGGGRLRSVLLWSSSGVAQTLTFDRCMLRVC
jgi:hypothetical protein